MKPRTATSGRPTGSRGGDNPQRNWKGAISPSMASGTTAKATIMAVAGATVRSPRGRAGGSVAAVGVAAGPVSSAGHSPAAPSTARAGPKKASSRAA